MFYRITAADFRGPAAYLRVSAAQRVPQRVTRCPCSVFQGVIVMCLGPFMSCFRGSLSVFCKSLDAVNFWNCPQ